VALNTTWQQRLQDDKCSMSCSVHRALMPAAINAKKRLVNESVAYLRDGLALCGCEHCNGLRITPLALRLRRLELHTRRVCSRATPYHVFAAQPALQACKTIATAGCNGSSWRMQS
jgi:hypothetical protein